MKENLINIGVNAKKASKIKIDTKDKNKVLLKFLKLINKNKQIILKENNKDIKFAIKNNLPENLIDRLTLNPKKLEGIMASINKIIKLSDPTNKILDKWKRPNGLIIKRVSAPIGVIGIIYESRPNVTSDIASLCLKSGNAVILKGGSEALNSNKILVKLFRKALVENKFNKNCVQLIEKKNRFYVDYLLSNMKKYIDIIIPRGGKSLVKRVQSKSSVPTIGHLEGICHVYIDSESDIKMAIKIVKNSKMRNVSICGAAETLLIDKKCLKTHCRPILNELSNLGCKIIGDSEIKKNFSGYIKIAKIKDWKTEYLSPIISVKTVNDIDDAIAHINEYGTSHTDSIVTKNKKKADNFLMKVKSSIAVHNASTQFADGGEFGFGAEVGISTTKLHPRGPVGMEQLTAYKYILKGKGQIRK